MIQGWKAGDSLMAESKQVAQFIGGYPFSRLSKELLLARESFRWMSDPQIAAVGAVRLGIFSVGAAADFGGLGQLPGRGYLLDLTPLTQRCSEIAG